MKNSRVGRTERTVFARYLRKIGNSNWTEWSTIQGVIERVIAKREADLKLRARLLPELYDTKSNY